jgi:ClpP class serine protease
MNLLHVITSKVFMIEPNSAQSYVPMIARLIRGERVHFNQKTIQASSFEEDYDEESYSKRGPQITSGVAIVSFRGVLTKDDPECEPGAGMESQMRMIEALGENPNVRAIVIDFDTPGGEATNCESVAKVIHEAAQKKPVIGWLNGMCCSAGYYLASACTEIYASQATDIVGSIGTMCTLIDMSAALEKEGIRMVEIYADGSDDKNKTFREALAGNYEPIKAVFLNPHREGFVRDVKGYRPNISDEVFTGEVYTAADAVTRLGMLDGIMTFNNALQRAMELSQPQPAIIKPNTTFKMKNITKVIGREYQHGTVLSAEEVLAIENALDGQLRVSSQELQDAINAQQSALQSQAEQVKALSEQVAQLAAMPGADKTTTPAPEVDEVMAEYEKRLRSTVR